MNPPVYLFYLIYLIINPRSPGEVNKYEYSLGHPSEFSIFDDNM